MSKFKDNFSSESFYPDSNYYLDQKNTSKGEKINFQKIKFQMYIEKFLNGQIHIGLLLREQMEDLQ